MAKIEFYGALVHVLDGRKEAEVQGDSVRAVLKNLEETFPVLETRFIRNDQLSSLFFIYVNGKDVRFTGGLTTPVQDGSRIRIMNALTGG